MELEDAEIKHVKVVMSDTTHHRNKNPKYRVITTSKKWSLPTERESGGQDLSVLSNPLVQTQLKLKLSSYLQQDKCKKIYDPDKFITFSELIQLLQDCDLYCHYCHQPIFLLYEKVCQNNQWTLDRLDNNYGHNYGNVCIACLKCNLNRRCASTDAYYFSKNLIVEKLSGDGQEEEVDVVDVGGDVVEVGGDVVDVGGDVVDDYPREI